MNEKIFERDLYEPIANLFVNFGYGVRSEVNNCDIVFFRNDEVIVVELKKSFNLKVIYQALDRQQSADRVYIGILKPKKQYKEILNMKKLLKKLGIGLILVTITSKMKYAQIILEATDKKRKNNNLKKVRLLNELDGRTDEYNVGGSNQRKIVTAYREQALEILCALDEHEELSLKDFREMGFGKKTGNILRDNFYNWFERKKRGVYSLSSVGLKELKTGEFEKVILALRKKNN